MSWRAGRRLAGLFLVSLLSSFGVAHAQESATVAPAVPMPSKEQCVEANGKAQEQRRDGKLRVAREWLMACASSACPALVRDDCARRLDELERAQPTIAFSVQDPNGSDLSEVVVSMDGDRLATRLDGTAMLVDVGQHTFRFEADGYETLTRSLIVLEGEKLRRERVALRPSGGVQTLQETEAATATVPPSETRALASGLGTQRLSGVVAGSVGAALLVGGIAFGMVASSRWSTAEKQCPTHMGCSAKAIHDRDTAAEYATVSTVGLVTGGVLVALGVTLFLTAPKAQRANLALSLAPHGLRLRGTF